MNLCSLRAQDTQLGPALNIATHSKGPSNHFTAAQLRLMNEEGKPVGGGEEAACEFNENPAHKKVKSSDGCAWAL